jgi:hypothetical protein
MGRGKDPLRNIPLRVELATYLLDDLVEEGVGVLGLDLLIDPPVGGEVRDVDLVGRTCAASENSDDAAIPSEDDGPRVASIRKLAVRLVIGQDGDLGGGLPDSVFIIAAGEGLETVGATDSRPRRQPILYDEQTLITMDVKVLGVADLIILDDAVGLEETIFGVLVGSIDRLREHCIHKSMDREVTACGGKKRNSQLKLKTRKTGDGKCDER